MYSTILKALMERDEMTEALTAVTPGARAKRFSSMSMNRLDAKSR